MIDQPKPSIPPELLGFFLKLEDGYELAGYYTEAMYGYDYCFKTWDDLMAFFTALAQQ